MTNRVAGGVIPGTTGLRWPVLIRDITTGAGQTGLANTDVVFAYYREGASAIVTPTLNALASATAAHSGASDSGWWELGGGWYLVDIPDNAIATGSPTPDWVICRVVDASGTDFHPVTWQLAMESSNVYTLDSGGVTLQADQAVNVTKVAGSATAATNLASGAEAATRATVNTTITPTTTQFTTTLPSSSDDFYLDPSGNTSCRVYFATGANAGISRQISDYVNATRQVTCDAFPNAPASGNVLFVIG